MWDWISYIKKNKVIILNIKTLKNTENKNQSKPQKIETITLKNAKQNLDALQEDEKRVILKVNKKKEGKHGNFLIQTQN